MRGRFHLVVEVQDLVCDHMNMAGSLEMKIVEKIYINFPVSGSAFQYFNLKYSQYLGNSS